MAVFFFFFHFGANLCRSVFSRNQFREQGFGIAVEQRQVSSVLNQKSTVVCKSLHRAGTFIVSKVAISLYGFLPDGQSKGVTLTSQRNLGIDINFSRGWSAYLYLRGLQNSSSSKMAHAACHPGVDPGLCYFDFVGPCLLPGWRKVCANLKYSAVFWAL